MTEKTPGQRAYETAILADAPGVDNETLERFWNSYLTSNCREKWESIASSIRAPLLTIVTEQNDLISDMRFELQSIRDNVCEDEGKVIDDLVDRAAKAESRPAC